MTWSRSRWRYFLTSWLQFRLAVGVAPLGGSARHRCDLSGVWLCEHLHPVGRSRL